MRSAAGPSRLVGRPLTPLWERSSTPGTMRDLASDTSSWPPTPSTTPLEWYLNGQMDDDDVPPEDLRDADMNGDDDDDDDDTSTAMHQAPALADESRADVVHPHLEAPRQTGSDVGGPSPSFRRIALPHKRPESSVRDPSGCSYPSTPLTGTTTLSQNSMLELDVGTSTPFSGRDILFTHRYDEGASRPSWRIVSSKWNWLRWSCTVMTDDAPTHLVRRLSWTARGGRYQLVSFNAPTTSSEFSESSSADSISGGSDDGDSRSVYMKRKGAIGGKFAFDGPDKRQWAWRSRGLDLELSTQDGLSRIRLAYFRARSRAFSFHKLGTLYILDDCYSVQLVILSLAAMLEARRQHGM